MITFVANGRTASYTSTDVITAGSVGIPVEVTLSEDFDGLSPIVVFEGSGAAVDVALVDNACVVPHEVVATAGGYLKIGIYARNGEGTIVIPTIWGNTCPILPGAVPSGVDPTQPTPDWTAQVQQIATDAYTKAEQAEGVANDAKTAAITAQDSAQASAEAAQTAREGAEAAQGFAETAESNARGFASDAAGSAGDAAAAKTAAETAEAHASGYATDALNAKNAAVAAKEAAVTAQGKAEQAQGKAEGYATTAGNKAGEAAQSASDALGYKNTAVSKAGEAANSATSAGNSATAANTDALKAEGFAVGEQNGTPVASGTYYENNAKYYAEQAEMAVQSGPITKTVSNTNPIAITDGADNVGVKQLLVNIIPTQDGTGDPSPTNIRAISGWTGATLTVNGTDTQFDFPAAAGTVYAGTLDVLTGVLTVGYAITTLTSDISVWKDTNFYFLLGSAGRVVAGKDGWCTHYKTVHPTSTAQLNATDYAITFNNSSLTGVNGRCFLRDSRYTTVGDLKAYWDAQNLAGTPVQVVYPIASPQTYQLTPQVVKTLLGDNSMNVDCGDLTLKYVVDLQTYVDDEAGALVEASDATTDTRINCEHGLVNYGYDTHVDKDVSNTAGLAGHLKRDFTVVEVSGTVSASNTASKIILSSPNLTGFAGTGASVDGLKLTDGHTYRFRQRHLSGTATNTVRFGAYKAYGISRISGDYIVDPVTGDIYTDLVYDASLYPDGIYACLVLIRTSTGNTLTNYKCNVTLEDITNGDIPLRVGDNPAYASTVGIVCPGTTAPQAITSGQYVIWGGKLYKATTAIASGETLTSGTNVEAVVDGGMNELLTKINRIGKWEKITQVTTTEDLETVEITTDSNGNTFELTQMLYQATLPASTTGTADYVSAKLQAKKANGTIAWYGCATLKYPTATSAFFEHLHVRIDDIVKSDSRAAGVAGGPTSVQSLCQTIDTVKALTGARIKQYTASSSLIPSGTVITIYGIRYYDD